MFNLLAKILNIDTSVPLPVFAYCFLKHAGGGAIATIGATRTAYGGVDSGAGKMSIEFFSAYAVVFEALLLHFSWVVYVAAVDDDGEVH